MNYPGTGPSEVAVQAGSWFYNMSAAIVGALAIATGLLLNLSIHKIEEGKFHSESYSRVSRGRIFRLFLCFGLPRFPISIREIALHLGSIPERSWAKL